MSRIETYDSIRDYTRQFEEKMAQGGRVTSEVIFIPPVEPSSGGKAVTWSSAVGGIPLFTAKAEPIDPDR